MLIRKSRERRPRRLLKNAHKEEQRKKAKKVVKNAHKEEQKRLRDTEVSEKKQKLLKPLSPEELMKKSLNRDSTDSGEDLPLTKRFELALKEQEDKARHKKEQEDQAEYKNFKFRFLL